MTNRQRSNISSFLSENTDYPISQENISFLKSLRAPSFIDKTNLLLVYLSRLTEFAGEYVEERESMIVRSWCLNKDEYNEVFDYLVKVGRVSFTQFLEDPVQMKITPEGWMKVEELEGLQSESNQGFMALSFSPAMLEICDSTIAPGISDAGYKPHRVDQREHNQKIDDEIIAQIRKSKFLVADFTEHKGGVYYEAGFAMGLGLPIFWLCNEDDLSALHFDIRQYNCIKWRHDGLPELRCRLAAQIESVLGAGPLHPVFT